MPIGYSQEGYRPTTALANLTTQGIGPIDVTRGGSIRYAPLAAISIPSSQPELVAQGIASGIQSAASGALSGVKAKWEAEQSLKVEEAKQTNKALDAINQQRLELAAKSGMEADYPEQDAKLVEAGKRIMGLIPSGYVKKEDKSKPATTQPPAQDFVHPIPVPPQGTEVLDGEAPLPVKDREKPDTTIPVAEIPTAPSAVVTAPAEDIPPYVPATQTLKPLTAATIQPQVAEQILPALSQVTQPIAQQEIPISQMQSQPQDPKAPRNVAGLTFRRNEMSFAHDAATKLSTPYWSVTAEQDPQSKEWSLKQTDMSDKVEKLIIDKNIDRRAAEKLILEQNADKRAQAKADAEALESQRKILKEDRATLEKQKSNINSVSTNINTIDDAIKQVESDPEIVGILTKAYTSGIPLIGIKNTADFANTLAFLGVKNVQDKMQKITDIQSTLSAVKSQIGWNKFAELKSLSPTGSAGIGALSDGERESLAETGGSLSIEQSPKKLLNTLYNLRNGAIKTIANAASEVKQVDNAFQMPEIRRLKMSRYDEDRIKKQDSLLSKATPEQKKSRDYLDALEELHNMLDREDQFTEFNKKFIPIR